MKTTIHIRGMYCPNCEKRVAAALGQLEGVKSVRVDYAAGEAEIESRRPLKPEQLDALLRELGYERTDGGQDLTRSVGLLIVLLGLAVILERTGLLNRLVPRQLGESGMSYGLFFVTGLLTSVHCVAMCGGIGLSQSLPGRGRWSAVLYNAGRVASYTLIGALLGLIGMLLGGASFAASTLLQGCVKLLAGALMLLAGVNLLGLFPRLRRLRLPLPKLRASSRLPFVIGLLNGLMPCGPLQAMQLAALGSESPVSGALSMLCFSLGTVPLMLGLGGLAVLLGLVSLIPGRRALRYGLSAVTLAALALVLSLRTVSDVPTEGVVRIQNGVQLIDSTLELGKYPDITVQAGLPVRWTIHADESAINGCNYRMIIPGLQTVLSFQPGDNVLEFTPEAAGTIPYSCWMGMIRGSITVTG